MRLYHNFIVNIILLGIIFQGNVACSQNLVYNPSFEIIEKCPDAGDLGPELISIAKGWSNPNMATPELMCNCNVPFPIDMNYITNFESPRQGNCVAGVCVFCGIEREYIQTELINPLRAGITYCARFYVSLCEGASEVEIKSIGAYFSNEKIQNSNMKYLP